MGCKWILIEIKILVMYKVINLFKKFEKFRCDVENNKKFILLYLG